MLHGFIYGSQMVGWLDALVVVGGGVGVLVEITAKHSQPEQTHAHTGSKHGPVSET